LFFCTGQQVISDDVFDVSTRLFGKWMMTALPYLSRCCVLVFTIVLLGSSIGDALAQQGTRRAVGQEASSEQKPLSIKSRSEFLAVQKEAESGDAYAQYRMAVAYSEGSVVKADDKTMVMWLKKAADQGLLEAQFYLAGMYTKGIGVEQDYTQAAKLMRQVAEKGVDMAQFNLGAMYEAGTGVPRDQKMAISWYRKAAAQGNPYAKNRLEQLRSTQTKKRSATSG
jgi:TPR repeat protein